MAKHDSPTSKLNVSLGRRLDLAKHAGYELDVLLEGIREQVAKMDTEEAPIVMALLDRAEIVVSTLVDVGMVNDDQSHNDQEFSAALRVVSIAMGAEAHATGSNMEPVDA